MFIASELLNEMCTYMGNPDLTNMARVCKEWHPTCVQHLSTQLSFGTWESFHPRCQQYLDNFSGTGHHPHIPTRPSHITAVKIILGLIASSTPTTVSNLVAIYALLDHLSHVRRLCLHATVSTDQLDMLDTVCREICARLPNVQHLTLSSSLRTSDTLPVAQQCPLAYTHIVSSYRLKSLKLRHDHPVDGPALFHTQTSTLMELDMAFPILANPMSGFLVECFLHVKKLSLHSMRVVDRVLDVPIGNRVLDFGKTFPSLKYLYMDTIALQEYGGEELGSILRAISTSRQLKRLTLVMSPQLKALPMTRSITFHHLETLALHPQLFNEAHLSMLASMQWPLLTSLFYQSDGVYPHVALRLLKNAPRLKWLKVRVAPNRKPFDDLAAMFGQSEWPNLQGVCIVNRNGHKVSTILDQLTAVQRACPNASIHITLMLGFSFDSILVDGIHLPPQCSKECFKCLIK